MSGTTKQRLIILIAIIIAAALSAAIFAVLYYSGVLLPKWAGWNEVTIEPGNKDIERIVLKNRKVRAYKDGKCIFTSPKGCRVQDAIYTDIDRDGEEELILLNFKIGRYGEHRPFWVKRNELKWFQHIYIYDYVGAEGYFRPIWMASDIGMDAASFRFDDGVLSITDTKGEVTKWIWRTWGLEKL